MYCPKCGTKISDSASFCPECGEPVAKRKAKLISALKAQKGKTPQPASNIWVVVIVICVICVFAGAKKVDTSNTIYANSSQSSKQNTSSQISNGNTDSNSIKEWGSNAIKDIEKTVTSIGGCKAKGCKEPVYKDGYCSHHYGYYNSKDAINQFSGSIQGALDGIKENVDSDSANDKEKGLSDLFK